MQGHEKRDFGQVVRCGTSPVLRCLCQVSVLHASTCVAGTSINARSLALSMVSIHQSVIHYAEACWSCPTYYHVKELTTNMYLTWELFDIMLWLWFCIVLQTYCLANTSHGFVWQSEGTVTTGKNPKLPKLWQVGRRGIKFRAEGWESA